MMRERATSDIAQYGWHMLGVFPVADRPQVFFCYTVGLWQTFKHPELACFGIRPEVAHELVRIMIDEHLKLGETYTDGQTVVGLAARDYAVFLRAMAPDNAGYPLSAAMAYYGDWDFPVLQVVFQDVNYKWPWEDGCVPNHIISQEILKHEQTTR